MPETNLQQQADALYQEAYLQIKKLKRIKRYKQALFGLCGLLLLVSPAKSTKENALAFTLLGACLAHASLDYQRKKEELEHDILIQVKSKEVHTPDFKNSSEEMINKNEFMIHLEEQGMKERNIAHFSEMISGPVLLVGYMMDKIPWQTGACALGLIMSASAYWGKNHFKNLNTVLKNSFPQHLQLDWREKERE